MLLELLTIPLRVYVDVLEKVKYTDMPYYAKVCTMDEYMHVFKHYTWH